MNLNNKKILVFGMGRSGISTLRFLARFKSEIWAVNKGAVSSWQNIEEIKGLVGESKALEEDDPGLSAVVSRCDLIILSPGIPRDHKILINLDSKKTPIWSEIELAYRFIENKKIVAVTGSNGKTTVVTMLGEIFKNAGYNVFVGGNIGIPLCEALLEDKKFDLYLLELSSFQLESMEEFRPNIAVVLNVFKNHTERYASVEEYAKAKFNIVKKMQKEDLLIVGDDNAIIKKWAQQLSAQVEVDYVDLSRQLQVKEEIEKEYDLSSFQLIGIHNITNLAFILKVCARLKIARKVVQAVINSFMGVDFRVQKIKTALLCQCFNDAKSTNWDATMTAINSLYNTERPLWVILGGQRRGESDSILPHLDFFKKRVQKIILIGDSRDLLATELADKIGHHKSGKLSEAIAFVAESGFEGNLLFSPAFQSFDQFKNYVDRGNSFNNLVKNIK